MHESMPNDSRRETRFLKWPKTVHQGCIVVFSIITMVLGAVTVGLISAVLQDPERWMPKSIYGKYPRLESMLIALGGVSGALIVASLYGCCGVYFGGGFFVVSYLILTVFTIAAQFGIVTLILCLSDEAETWAYSQANCPICRYDFQRAFNLVEASTTLIIISSVIQVLMLYCIWKVLREELYHDSIEITSPSWSPSPKSTGAPLIRTFIQRKSSLPGTPGADTPRLSLYPMSSFSSPEEPLPEVEEIEVHNNNNVGERVQCDCAKCHPDGTAEPSEYSKQFAATQTKIRSLLTP
ncbi:hypothetical protein CAPTEDRAFT_220513 [Capitella teleta]|uniref:Tetraspanin n=1 Tax=Capitella teleta TaxID=283909 RepID=R7TGS5_CAPTE|nr:hypothetical protein CAPTEDRAFT_220513 [Capitella teleta]|eukprot:ELT93003.1 hypothetical protein CAPTEDRAFT_220513 [Capitella teleta]